MSRYRQIINNFLGGEISPKSFGRTDLPEYFVGCATLENFLVIPQGGAQRRSGTQILDSTNIVSKSNIKLIPFTGSDGEKFIVMMPVLGDAINIFKISDGTNVTITDDGDTGFDITTSPYTAAQLGELQFGQTGDILTIVHGSVVPHTIIYRGSDNFSFAGFFSTRFNLDLDVQDSGGNEIISHFPERWAYQPPNEDPTGIQIRLSLVGPVHSPLVEGDAVVLAAFESDGTTLVPGFFTGYGATSNGFFSNDFSMWKFSDGTNTISLRVFDESAGAGDGSSIAGRVTGGEIPNLKFVGVAAGTDWERPAWSRRDGWPRTITFFQQRQYFGGNGITLTDTLWGSQTGDILEFMARKFVQDSDFGTVLNTDAFSFTIASDKINIIRWIRGSRTLETGTDSKEYNISPPENGDSLGPLSIDVRGETFFGSAPVQAQSLDSSTMFVQRSSQLIREFVIGENTQTFQSADLMHLSEHLPRRVLPDLASPLAPKIIQLATQGGQRNMLWAIDNNGSLFGATIDRTRGINAWNYQKLGGLLSGEPAQILSIATQQSDDDLHDDLYMAVLRTIDGGSKLYLEKIGRDFIDENIFNSSTSIDDKPVFSDSAKLVRLGGPGVTFTGFSHLKGETVDVLADGAFIGTKVVNSSGEIILDNNATEVIAGLNYVSILKPTSVEAGAALGSAQGAMKRIEEVVVRFFRTVGAKIGESSTNTDDIQFRPDDLPMDEAIPPFTGDKKIEFDGDYNRNTQAVIVQDLPLPITVLAIIYSGLTYD